MTSFYLVTKDVLAAHRDKLERLRAALRSNSLLEADSLASVLSKSLRQVASRTVRIKSEVVDAARAGDIAPAAIAPLLKPLWLESEDAAKLVAACDKTSHPDLKPIGYLAVATGEAIIILAE